MLGPGSASALSRSMWSVHRPRHASLQALIAHAACPSPAEGSNREAVQLLERIAKQLPAAQLTRQRSAGHGKSQGAGSSRAPAAAAAAAATGSGKPSSSSPSTGPQQHAAGGGSTAALARSSSLQRSGSGGLHRCAARRAVHLCICVGGGTCASRGCCLRACSVPGAVTWHSGWTCASHQQVAPADSLLPPHTADGTRSSSHHRRHLTRRQLCQQQQQQEQRQQQQQQRV
jgi:hypothetical protein